MPGRNVDTELISRLAIGSYLVKHQDVVLQGPTGAGKTYVACALGNKACQQYRKVLYLPAGELFDRLTIAERTDCAGMSKRFSCACPGVAIAHMTAVPAMKALRVYPLILFSPPWASGYCPLTWTKRPGREESFAGTGIFVV